MGPRMREDKRGMGRRRTASTGEKVVGDGIHPHPFDKLRAGSNLPL